MIKIYGSMLCKDCVNCVNDLNKAGVEFVFLDFAQDLQSLKDFLKLRDGNELFNGIRTQGSIGIPAIVLDDGTLTLEWKQFCDLNM